MKNLWKILLGVAVLGGGAALLAGSDKIAQSGTYENKGKIAQWKITDTKGVFTAFIKFPGQSWDELGMGSLESLGELIDQRMRTQGYLPA